MRFGFGGGRRGLGVDYGIGEVKIVAARIRSWVWTLWRWPREEGFERFVALRLVDIRREGGFGWWRVLDRGAH